MISLKKPVDVWPDALRTIEMINVNDIREFSVNQETPRDTELERLGIVEQITTLTVTTWKTKEKTR